MLSSDSLQRQLLPIPDRNPVGVTPYDVENPETNISTSLLVFGLHQRCANSL